MRFEFFPFSADQARGCEPEFRGDLLQTTPTEAVNSLSKSGPRSLGEERAENIVELCDISVRPRAKLGVRLSRRDSDVYRSAETRRPDRFFEALAQSFARPARSRACRPDAEDPFRHNARRSAGSRRAPAARIVSALNLAPGATQHRSRARSREHLLALWAALRLGPVDRDFVQLFRLLVQSRFSASPYDWSTPAIVLEKIIRYSPCKEIDFVGDLRARIDPPDRRCYAFFHPASWTAAGSSSRVALSARDARFYCADSAATGAARSARGDDRDVRFDREYPARLAVVSFGSFLIKQVVEEYLARVSEAREFITSRRYRIPARGSRANVMRRQQRLQSDPTRTRSPCSTSRAGSRGLNRQRVRPLCARPPRRFFDRQTRKGRRWMRVARFSSRQRRATRSYRSDSGSFGEMHRHPTRDVNYRYDL